MAILGEGAAAWSGEAIASGRAIDPRAERAMGGLMTVADVQEALVEAADVHHRHTRTGRNPFASDGPWALIDKDWEQFANDQIQGRRAAVRKGPPSRADLAMMRERVEWFALIPSDDDRRLVVAAVRLLASGAQRVPWGRLVRPVARWKSADGLRMRYDRAMSKLTQRVNLRLRNGADAQEMAEISKGTCQGGQ